MARTLVKNLTLESTPVGTIKPHASSNSPSGFLPCDGSAVSRTTYSRLFNEIGTTYGNGDGSTTFNLPDLRGEFVRGADDMGTAAGARGADASSGRTAGNSQGEATASNGLSVSGSNQNNDSNHDHNFSDSDSIGNHDHGGQNSLETIGHSSDTVGFGGSGSGNDIRLEHNDGAYNHEIRSDVPFDGGHTVNISGGTGNQNSNHSHSWSGNVSGDSETRPRNVATNYIIKV